MCMVQLWSVGSECIIYDCVCIKVADEKRNTANDTQYYYDVKNEKVLMIFDGMVDGEDNPIQNYFWSGADMIEVRKYLT